MLRSSCRLASIAVLAAAILVPTVVLAADGIDPPLRIGTKTAPPFAFQDGDGRWRGLSIELWERIALAIGRRSEYVEYDLADLLDATSAAEVDVAVGAITMSRDREERMNFSHPFLETGLAIAVDPGAAGGGIASALLSLRFLRAVSALLFVLLVAGSLVWIFERRANSEEFPSEPVRGLGEALWWSGVTMTTVGYGDKAPRSLAGRVVAFVWMFASIIMIATFTGAIASALTVDRLSSSIVTPSDLGGKRVAVVEDSIAEAAVIALGARAKAVEDLPSALSLLDEGAVDAAVHDAPILIHILQTWEGASAVLPLRFQEQGYAFAFPSASDLREPVNRALLTLMENGEWSQLRARYLGPGE